MTIYDDYGEYDNPGSFYPIHNEKPFIARGVTQDLPEGVRKGLKDVKKPSERRREKDLQQRLVNVLVTHIEELEEEQVKQKSINKRL